MNESDSAKSASIPTTDLPPEVARALDVEARRIYHRYVVEFVEAHSLCPWAVRARQEGHVSVRTVMCSQPDIDDAMTPLIELSEDLNTEVGLLVFPRLEVSRSEFDAFVSNLREADSARQSASPAMAAAAFHPDATPNAETPARLVPFIRRSPDPTVQLVRLSVLESVRRPSDRGTAFMNLADVDIREFLKTPPKVPLHERVAVANQSQLLELGLDTAEAILQDIRRDRNESYARILGEG